MERGQQERLFGGWTGSIVKPGQSRESERGGNPKGVAMIYESGHEANNIGGQTGTTGPHRKARHTGWW